MSKINFKILASFPVVTLLFCFLLFSTSCKKKNGDENATLSFSTATVTFDTVFSTVGSTTKRLIVHNENNFPVTTDIFLAGGKTSAYSINVDGVSGTDFRDVEIPSKDSIFILVKVIVNPGSQNTPFLVTDSILFYTGNRTQDVDLLAYGQNAYFHVADQQTGSIKYKVVAGEHETTTWKNDKPHVVYGYAVVDSLGGLIIEPGTQIYLHQGAGIWVYKYGNIQVEGTKEQPVIFQGDRKESWYDTDYSQWDCIWINEGNIDNHIKYATIKNAALGIQVEAMNEYLGNRTYIENCIIKNTTSVGISGKATDLSIINCEISNNGAGSLDLAVGNFVVQHVTIANYFTQSTRKGAAVSLRNSYSIYVIDENGEIKVLPIEGDTRVRFVNSIITGYSEEEIAVYINEKNSLEYTFENCIIKANKDLSAQQEHFINCLFSKENNYPKFTDFKNGEYTLTSGSPAIRVGKENVGVDVDLLGNSRHTPPDIGAYETE